MFKAFGKKFENSHVFRSVASELLRNRTLSKAVFTLHIVHNHAFQLHYLAREHLTAFPNHAGGE